MGQHVIELEPADYAYIERSARTLGISVEAFLKRLIERQKSIEDLRATSGDENRRQLLLDRLKRAQKRVQRHLSPGQNLADELIADRRRESILE